MTPLIIVWDLDGVLADDNHRSHFLRQTPKQWDRYFDLLSDDTPIEPVCQLFRSLRWDHLSWILTSRPKAYHIATQHWLDKHDLSPDRLIMRPPDNYEDDTTLKLSQLAPYRDQTLCVFEDRDRVVAAYREAGYICLQPQPGPF